MNMIPTGAFLTEMDASEKKETLAEQFVSIWEKKNSKIARAGGVSLMALSLAACGSSSDDTAATDTPAAETPAEETPAAETPAEETPAEETPVEVTPVVTALTADADATGTAGADTFTAATGATTAATTLVGTNDIAGGEGADVLQLSMDANFGGFTVTGTDTGSMTGIETVELTNAGSIARTFDATGVSGVETYKVDGTNGIVNITDSADLAAIELSNIASGAFSITYAAPTGGTSPVAGTADTLSLTVEGMGSATADVSVTAAGVETLAVTSNAAATAAGATNYLDLSGVSSATAITIAGAADTDVAAVSTTTTSFDASAATGAVTAVLTAAVADGLETIKTGSGDDSVTAVITDMPVNATIDLGEGADTLTLSGAGETTQYAMSGVETLNVTDVTGTATFSMAKAGSTPTTVNMGEAGAATPNPFAGTSVSFIGDSGAKTFNVVGDSTGAASTDSAGAATLNVSADSKATKANGGDTAAMTFTADTAASLDVNVSGFVNQTGAISAAKATTATVTLGSDQAQTALKVSAAKAETVSITDGKGATLNAASDFTAAKTITIDTKGTFTNAEVLPAAHDVTISGSGTKAKYDGNALIGATDLSYDLTVTASGLDAGFDTSGGNLDAGSGSLTLDLSGISTGNITTGTLDAAGSITVTADTLGTFTTGATTGKAVTIDAADVLGTTSFGAITADASATVDGSTLVANTLAVTASATSTALTVDFDGGVGIDALTVDTGAKSKTITITGDAGVGADTINVDVNAYTADTTSTVTIDVSGIAVDTTNQTAIEIDLGGELNNDIVITAGSGTGDTVDMENGTYTGDITFTKVDTITSTGGLFTATAASFNGAELAINAGAVTHVLNGTANNDVINLADVTMTAGDLSISALAGDDTITGTAAADAITAGDGADTIKGADGIDAINLSLAAGNAVDTSADVIDISDVDAAADRDTVTYFDVANDTVKIANTAGVDSGDTAGALVNVAGIAGLTIDDIIVDTTVNLAGGGAQFAAVGDQSSVFTSGGYVFDSTTGALYADADGDFTAGTYQIATLDSDAAGTAIVAAAAVFVFA